MHLTVNIYVINERNQVFNKNLKGVVWCDAAASAPLSSRDSRRALIVTHIGLSYSSIPRHDHDRPPPKLSSCSANRNTTSPRLRRPITKHDFVNTYGSGFIIQPSPSPFDIVHRSHPLRLRSREHCLP